MGRPRKRPTIKPHHLKSGGLSFLVTASIGGKQEKKVCPDMDSAKALAAKWRGANLASLNYFPTRLEIDRLRHAETADPIWASLGLTAIEAATWMLQNYKKPADGLWYDVIAEFHQARRLKHRLKDGVPDKPHIINLIAAIKSFAAFVKRPHIGNPTQTEVESWLKTRGGYNQLLGDLRSFCLWATKRGKMPSDPTLAIERQVRVRGKIPTTLKPEQVAHMMHTLETEAPEWVPYAAVCTFDYVRPYTRDGEAQRVDQDIRNGVEVVRKDGLFVILAFISQFKGRSNSGFLKVCYQIEREHNLWHR